MDDVRQVVEMKYQRYKSAMDRLYMREGAAGWRRHFRRDFPESLTPAMESWLGRIERAELSGRSREEILALVNAA